MENKEPICDAKKKSYFVGLWLTDGCNLRCRYCFQDHYKPVTRMSQEVLDQTIKYLNESNPQGVAFFGGEPLTALKAMKQVLAQTKVKRFYLTTNGTLLNDDVLDWLELHKVHLNLSLDGTKETQDFWRDGSYDRIMENLPRILHHMNTVSGQVLCTCVMESQLYKNVKHIKDLGFKSVYINQLDGYSSKVRNELSKLHLFREQYKKVLGLDSPTFEVSDYRRWRMILRGDEKPGHCGYGNLGLGISASGDFYACHRGPEFSFDFSFGNVFDGIDEAKMKEIRGAVFLPPKCEACDIHFNQCPVSCYQEHGEFGVDPHEIHCAYERAKVELIIEQAALDNEEIVLKSPLEKVIEEPRLIVGTMIDPHKLYVLPIFLNHLSKMEFPPVTDYYFILDEGDFTTYKLLSGWKEGYLKPDVVYDEGMVRSFKTVRIPIHESDSGLDRITRGRQLMLGLALKGNYTHLFFLDSDIISPRQTVRDLMQLDSGIAGGLVKTRGIRRRSWYNTYIDKRDEGEGFPSKTDFKIGEVIDVDATGCDCVLLRRDVLEAVGKYEWQRDPAMGEDMWFCLKAREKGFKVRIHTGIETRHLGVLDMALKELKAEDVNYTG